MYSRILPPHESETQNSKFRGVGLRIILRRNAVRDLRRPRLNK